MKRNLPRAILSGVLSLALLCVSVPAAGAAPEEKLPPHEGYIVGLKGSPASAALLGAEAGEDFLVVERPEDVKRIPADRIAYVEPNYLVELLEGPETPDDPFYQDYQWNLQQIHLPALCGAGLTGSGVKVGFVDSGIRTTHEDLAGSRLSGVNLLEENGSIEDQLGHGTFAGGIVLAQTGNGLGLAGVAPGVDFHAYRVFTEKTTTVSAVVRGLDRAVEDGCRVINLSLGVLSSNTLLENSVKRALDKGCILVAAVGNNYDATLNYPAAYEGVIGVGSVDRDLRVSAFSNRNESVDFTAPGNQVVSLDSRQDDGYRLDGERGTSYAAPIVTGLAALALEYDGRLDAGGVKALLEQSAVDLGEPGRDDSYGCGLVDGEKLLRALERPYAIRYETDGGTLAEGSPLEYKIKDNEIPLPEPVREGFLFAGWYDTADFSGAPVSFVPAGAVGDLTYYAGWQPEADLLPRELRLAGVRAQLQEDGSYLALLPQGTDLSALTKAQVEVVPGPAAQAVWVSESAEPGTFLVSVQTGAPSVTRVFLLRASCADRPVPEPNPDGSVTEVLRKDGRITEIRVTLPLEVCSQAGESPIPLTMPQWPEGVPLRLRAEAPVRVLIPVEKPAPGMTAVRQPENGAEMLIRKTAVTDTALGLTAEGEMTLTRTDRSRSFADTEDHWSADAVRFVTGRELFAGIAENLFGPDLPLNRAMLVQVLYSLEGRPESSEESRFTDVPEDSWYADAVAWASDRKVTAGYGGGRFGPEDPVTREQAAVMLYSYAGRPGSSGKAFAFTDEQDISGFAREAMGWAAENGIIRGVGGGRAEPLRVSGRAETAAMLRAFCTRLF